jgi:hypothetical protein
MERAAVDIHGRAPPPGEPVYIDLHVGKSSSNCRPTHSSSCCKAASRCVSDASGSDGGTDSTVAQASRRNRWCFFERFHRIEGTPGRSQEGSGIGLALVQELVKLRRDD